MPFENEEAKRRFLGFLGLCRRAGKTVCGTPMVCAALGSRQKPYLVLYAQGASAATQKKVTCKCAFYGVPAVAIEVTPAELGQAVGKTGNLAALAVTDEGFAAAMQEKLQAAN